jgi:hypothetical protein
LGEIGRERVRKEYDWEGIVDLTERVYSRIMDG